ncbi:LysR family transcriptional regulator [Streptomyces canus]|uniref:LysR family transcriptional regulator n=1 Tax=Streptomyces canus TaxID=58343 RepID=UPI002E2B24A2|nr:LysR family transcriptional regulator [Streptomyces canus]
MDIRQLEYFLAIVDRGGFNRAAAALYVSQPALSQAVRALERDLGSELFHRIGRRAVLTEAGRALIEPAREAVRSLETARASVASVHELREGRLDVASTPTQAVEPLTTLVSAFSRRYPGVSVAIKAAFTARDVIDMVRTGAVELGLLASAGPVSGKEVVFHELGRQRFVLVVPADGPFAGRTAVECRELAGQRLIVGQPGTGMRAYVDALREQGIEFTVAAESEHRVSLMPLVLAGVGLMVVTDAWRDLARRLGARVLDIEPETGLDIALVSRRGSLSPAAAAFVTSATSATDS